MIAANPVQPDEPGSTVSTARADGSPHEDAPRDAAATEDDTAALAAERGGTEDTTGKEYEPL